MAKAPTYQMYASDFEMDTASWEVEEVGIYIRLLNSCWVNQGLPTSLKKLARICRVDLSFFEVAWKETLSEKFFEQDGKFLNEKQEEVRAFRNKQHENGSKGGRPRNPNKTQIKPKPNPNESFHNEIEIEIEEEIEIEGKGVVGGISEQERDLIDQITEKFQLIELENHHRRVVELVRKMHKKGKHAYLERQHKFYHKYKEKSEEKKHGISGYLDNWDSHDWQKKFESLKNGNIKEELITEGDYGKL